MSVSKTVQNAKSLQKNNTFINITGANKMNYSNFSVAFGMPGGVEWILIAIAGLLIFGNRLPEVGKSLGRSITEFKKGLKGIQDDIEQTGSKDQQDPK